MVFDAMTRTHLNAGRILGIPVGFNLSWIVVLALVIWVLGAGYFPEAVPDAAAGAVWGGALVGAFLFFGSILAHEFGHALAARAFGIPVHSVTMFALGGVSRIGEEPRTAWEEFVIAAAGPAVSVLLAVLFTVALAVPGAGPVTGALLAYLALVNGALAIFNLVPAFPLDGGRILRAVLWAIGRDSDRATRWAVAGGRVFGLSLVLVGVAAIGFGAWMFAFWLAVVGIFIERSAYGHVNPDEPVESALEPVRSALGPAEINLGQALDAERLHPSPAFLMKGKETEGSSVALEDEMEPLTVRAVTWRARLEALPRPGDVLDEIQGDDPDPQIVNRYQEDRMEMYRILDDIEDALRSPHGDYTPIEVAFGNLEALFERWTSDRSVGLPPEEQEFEASIVAGRPESFAPSPEEALGREPGSSIEI